MFRVASQVAKLVANLLLFKSPFGMLPSSDPSLFVGRPIFRNHQAKLSKYLQAGVESLRYVLRYG